MKVRKLSNNNCIREMVKFKFSNGGRKCIRRTNQDLGQQNISYSTLHFEFMSLFQSH